MENKKIVEYYPSNEGLKNIYSKFLKFGSIEDLDNLILLYTNDIRKKVIDSYIEDGEDEEMAQFINEGKKNDFQDGKLRWDLLPLEEIEDIVKVYTSGANKYGENTWQLLDNGYQRYKAAMLRHLLEYEKGNKVDEDTGCQHLAQVAWNAIAMLYLDKHGKGKEIKE